MFPYKDIALTFARIKYGEKFTLVYQATRRVRPSIHCQKLLGTGFELAHGPEKRSSPGCEKPDAAPATRGPSLSAFLRLKIKSRALVGSHAS